MDEVLVGEENADEVGDGESTVADTVVADHDLFEPEEDFGALSVPLTQDARSSIFIVTVHEGFYDPSAEPNIRGQPLIEAAAYQSERGRLKPRRGMEEEKMHVHVAVRATKRLRCAQLTKLVCGIFPKTGTHQKDIRVASHGVDFQAVGNYVCKPSHRLQGTEPTTLNFEPGKRLPKRKWDDEKLVEAIQGCESTTDLAANGATRGLLRYNTAKVIAIHAERRSKKIMPLTYGWEKALRNLLNRSPKDDDTIHWFCPKVGEHTPKHFDRILRNVRAELNECGQARQVAIHDSAGNIEALTNSMDAFTKAIFVMWRSEAPLSLKRLRSLKNDTLAIRTQGGRSDAQELELRHLIVLGDDLPPGYVDGVCTMAKNIKVWFVDEEVESEWTHKVKLLDCAEPLDPEHHFLDTNTVGVSGTLKAEVEAMGE